jgi:hypothetical protein
MKKQRGKPNPTITHRLIARLADNFYAQSPLWRMLARGRLGRKLMRAYRELKNSRRPQCFRQDVW